MANCFPSGLYTNLSQRFGSLPRSITKVLPEFSMGPPRGNFSQVKRRQLKHLGDLQKQSE